MSDDLTALRAAAARAADPKLYGAEAVRADLHYRAVTTPKTILALVDEVERLRETCRCGCILTE